MYRLFLSWRYLVHRPINLLGVAGVTLGVWALIVVVSLFTGYRITVEEHVRGAGSDITVVGITGGGPEYRRIEATLREDDEVVACAPRLAWYGLLHPKGKKANKRASSEARGGGPSLGLDSPYQSLVGIDPVAETAATGFRSWLEAADPALRVASLDDPLASIDQNPAILISQGRMKRESLRPGDRVQMTTGRWMRGPHGRVLQSKAYEFTVVGAFKTRHFGFDDSHTFVPIAWLHDLLGGPEANEVAVALRIGADETAAALRLESGLVHLYRSAEAPPPQALTWRRINRTFLASIAHQESIMKMVLVVILVVAMILIFATLSMMVTEKTRDIGILAAMGASPWGILRVFLSCGQAITVAGISLGLLAGCLSAVYMDAFNSFMRDTFAVDLFPVGIYLLDRVPYSLDPWWMAQVCAIALVAGILAAGIPAGRAALHDPVRSLRHE